MIIDTKRNLAFQGMYTLKVYIYSKCLQKFSQIEMTASLGRWTQFEIWRWNGGVKERERGWGNWKGVYWWSNSTQEKEHILYKLTWKWECSEDTLTCFVSLYSVERVGGGGLCVGVWTQLEMQIFMSGLIRLFWLYKITRFVITSSPIHDPLYVHSCRQLVYYRYRSMV